MRRNTEESGARVPLAEAAGLTESHNRVNKLTRDSHTQSEDCMADKITGSKALDASRNRT